MTTFDNQGGELDITVQTGGQFVLPLTWQDENGALVDFTGYTAKGQIRTDEYPGGDIILDLASYISASGTTLSITVPDTVTAALSPASGLWDLFVKPSGGQFEQLLYGKATIEGRETA